MRRVERLRALSILPFDYYRNISRSCAADVDSSEASETELFSQSDNEWPEIYMYIVMIRVKDTMS